MQSSEPSICPVCGRVSENPEKCSFCGTSLTGQKAPAPPAGEHLPASGFPADRERREPQWSTPPPSAPLPQPWPQGPVPVYRFGGFWIRVAANLVDSLLLQVILWLLFAVGILGYSSGSQEELTGDTLLRFYQLDWSYLVTLELIVGMAYLTIFLGSRGQTPGKMMCRLKVIRTDGTELNYSLAMLRSLGYYLIHYFTLNLGFLWVAVDPRKQGLHDKLAKTYVIRLVPGDVSVYSPRFPEPPQG